MKRTLSVVIVAVGAAMSIVLAGCATSSETSDGPNTSSSPAVGAGSPATAATSQPTASESREAWVRGTKATLTNSTGISVDVDGGSGSGDFMPAANWVTLPTGSSRNEAEEWSSASGTSVYFRVAYSNSDVIELKVANPSVGTPQVTWRKGYSVYNWSSDTDGSSTFDENTTQTLTIEGHQVQVTRGGDDGDNKNWTLTLV